MGISAPTRGEWLFLTLPATTFKTNSVWTTIYNRNLDFDAITKLYFHANCGASLSSRLSIGGTVKKTIGGTSDFEEINCSSISGNQAMTVEVYTDAAFRNLTCLGIWQGE